MKNVYIDVHMLITTPLSRINCDDAGMPKTLTYGDTSRLEISSACKKHAMRQWLKEHEETNGIRTACFGRLLTDELCKNSNFHGTREEAEQRADAVVEALKRDPKKKGCVKTMYFLSQHEISDIAKIAAGSENVTKYLQDKATNKDKPSKNKSSKEKSSDGTAKKNNSTEKIKDEILAMLCKKENMDADMVLMGRMLADNARGSLDGSMYMAPLMATHKVVMQPDYFTAHDDLSDTGEAQHIDTRFNASATMYGYASIDTLQTYKNNRGDRERTLHDVKAGIASYVQSVPSGGSRNFAHNVLPDLVVISVRTDRPVQLCGAFNTPVRSQDGDFSVPSAKALFAKLKAPHKFDEPENHIVYVTTLDELSADAIGTDEPTFNDALADVNKMVNDLFDWKQTVE